MTRSIQSTDIKSTNGKNRLVGGDVPHTLAFIVSSVFKELRTTSTQTLRGEANFANNDRRYLG